METKRFTLKAEIFSYLSELYYNCGDKQQALKLLNDAIVFVDLAKNNLFKVILINNIATILINQEQYRQALNYLEEGYAILDKEKIHAPDLMKNIRKNIYKIRNYLRNSN